MSLYLLDTCVLSELVKREVDAGVTSWLSAQPDAALRVSVISLGELERGVQRLQEGKRKTQLAQWLTGIHDAYEDRILDVRPAVAREWGRLMAAAEASGAKLPVMDAWIAATARVHGCFVATRNVADMTRTGTMVHNPWAA